MTKYISGKTDGDITFNARELIDELHSVDEDLYENVLDTIADSFGRLGTWSDDEEGNMILHEDEDFDAEVDVRQGRKLDLNPEQMAWVEAQNRKIDEAAKNPRKNARILDKYFEELTDYIESMSAETFGAEMMMCIHCANEGKENPMFDYDMGGVSDCLGCGDTMCQEHYESDSHRGCEGFHAETFESQYAGGFGSGSLSDVGISSNQLTSTWGSGDFDSASLNSSGHQNVFARAETHSHTPHDYYTPVGPSDTPDVSGYLSQDTLGDINTFMSEEGNAPVQDPMEFGEMANWTPLDGSEGLKRKRAESPNATFEANFDFSKRRKMECGKCHAKGFAKNGNPCRKCDGAGYWMIPAPICEGCETVLTGSMGAECDSCDDWYCNSCLNEDGCPSCSGVVSFHSESFAAEYSGPSTLSSALSGARKTGRNGKHLTIIQRLVAKYGIDKGVKIYKHFGVKQKRASPKVRGKTRGTKSGPRRYSEGRVGGAGRSQVYQKGDRTGSWTPSGGHTTRFANSGKAWYQERGYGTPVAGPVPDTDLAGKSMGEQLRGHFVNPAGIVGYPFVPAQQRERKSKK